jgi:hypothetical protein
MDVGPHLDSFIIPPPPSPSSHTNDNSNENESEDSNNDDPADKRRSLVWVGPRGARTHLHYDAAFNVYSQVYGQKSFLLFPAASWDAMYLYPFIHPGAKQSQVNMSGGCAALGWIVV